MLGINRRRRREQSGERPHEHRVTLLSKPGCHLCDVARSVIENVTADLDLDWNERDITRSPEDTRAYWDKIPVVLVDGKQHAYGRVSADRLRRELTR